QFNPNHTFSDPGTYIVTQYITNGCGDDSSSVYIQVMPPPQVGFTVPDVACTNAAIQFENTSGPVAGYEWDFGNGSSSTLSHPSLFYTEPGTYTVTLTGFGEQFGCPGVATQELIVHAPPTAEPSLDNPDGCTPLTVSFSGNAQGGQYYSWNFGDGNQSVSPNPSHTFWQPGTYDVQLVVTNNQGCSDTSLLNNLFAYPLPQVSFEYAKDQDCGLPVGVSFQNTSADADAYLWTFGTNGPESNLTSPGHTFDEAGTVQVRLIASNQYGCQDTTTQLIPFYEQPIASISLEPATGCSPFSVPFVNQSQNADAYFWDFGDGFFSSERHPTHLYETAGLYPVELIASYEDVCFDTLMVENWIEVLQSPEANFDYQFSPPDLPQGTVQFFDLSKHADLRWWDFGDGSQSSEENPVHRYYQDGLFQVSLEVEASNGCMDDTLMYLQPPVFGRLYVPNAFSPDQGLGESQLFLPKGIGIKEYQLQIFSTYGQLIWQSNDLTEGQPAQGWNGMYKGNPLPQDTYVWKVKAIFEDGTVWNSMPDEKGHLRKMGTVVLLR
ncbi:MAG: PKD domain-containing protein, partial [Phaeodactylibacter sp.]|nr:PKD domain-containing protein [Phaeodactylibacter sp.]